LYVLNAETVSLLPSENNNFTKKKASKMNQKDVLLAEAEEKEKKEQEKIPAGIFPEEEAGNLQRLVGKEEIIRCNF